MSVNMDQIEKLKRKVLKKCSDRIQNGEKRVQTGTLGTIPNLKRKYLF